MGIASYFRHIISTVFTLTIFSLAWRQGNIELSYIPKPFEALIVVVFILMVLEYFFSEEARVDIARMRPVFKLYGILFAGLATFMIISLMTSFATIPESSLFVKKIFFEYGRAIFAFFSFFIAAYATFRYKEKINWFLGALMISPFVFYFAFVTSMRSFFVANYRLIGAQGDPNYTTSFISIGLIIAAVFYLYNKSRSKWLGCLYIIFSMPLFLWANSRGVIISIAVTLVLLSILYLFQEISWKRIFSILILFSVFVLSIPVAFSVLPAYSQVLMYQRSIAPVLPNEDIRDKAAEFILSSGVETLNSPAPSDNFGRSRGNVWKSAFLKTVKSPLGFGPAYHWWSPVEPGAVAHNLWMEVSLNAGWGGLLVWFVFISAIFRSAAKIFKQKNFVGTALPIVLLSLLISGTFVDIFTLRWLWLILGMVVGYSLIDDDAKTKSVSSPADV